MDIPSIIKQQLFGTGAMKVWSWGAHKWLKSNENTLSFKVQAHRFKGFISITYNEGMDLYDIYFFDNKTISGFIKNSKSSVKFKPIKGVYFDQMVALIDERIEKLNTYIN